MKYFLIKFGMAYRGTAEEFLSKINSLGGIEIVSIGYSTNGSISTIVYKSPEKIDWL